MIVGRVEGSSLIMGSIPVGTWYNGVAVLLSFGRGASTDTRMPERLLIAKTKDRYKETNNDADFMAEGKQQKSYPKSRQNYSQVPELYYNEGRMLHTKPSCTITRPSGLQHDFQSIQSDLSTAVQLDFREDHYVCQAYIPSSRRGIVKIVNQHRDEGVVLRYGDVDNRLLEASWQHSVNHRNWCQRGLRGRKCE